MGKRANPLRLRHRHRLRLRHRRPLPLPHAQAQADATFLQLMKPKLAIISSRLEPVAAIQLSTTGSTKATLLTDTDTTRTVLRGTTFSTMQTATDQGCTC